MSFCSWLDDILSGCVSQNIKYHIIQFKVYGCQISFFSQSIILIRFFVYILLFATNKGTGLTPSVTLQDLAFHAAFWLISWKSAIRRESSLNQVTKFAKYFNILAFFYKIWLLSYEKLTYSSFSTGQQSQANHVFGISQIWFRNESKSKKNYHLNFITPSKTKAKRCFAAKETLIVTLPN